MRLRPIVTFNRLIWSTFCGLIWNNHTPSNTYLCWGIGVFIFQFTPSKLKMSFGCRASLAHFCFILFPLLIHSLRFGCFSAHTLALSLSRSLLHSPCMALIVFVVAFMVGLMSITQSSSVSCHHFVETTSRIKYSVVSESNNKRLSNNHFLWPIYFFFLSAFSLLLWWHCVCVRVFVSVPSTFFCIF